MRTWWAKTEGGVYHHLLNVVSISTARRERFQATNEQTSADCEMQLQNIDSSNKTSERPLTKSVNLSACVAKVQC